LEVPLQTYKQRKYDVPASVFVAGDVGVCFWESNDINASMCSDVSVSGWVTHNVPRSFWTPLTYLKAFGTYLGASGRSKTYLTAS
jgi:hypothetical protein